MPVSSFYGHSGYVNRPFTRSNSSSYIPTLDSFKYSLADTRSKGNSSEDNPANYFRSKYIIPEDVPASSYLAPAFTPTSRSGYQLTKITSTDNISQYKSLPEDNRIQKSTSTSSFLTGNTANIQKNFTTPEHMSAMALYTTSRPKYSDYSLNLPKTVTPVENKQPEERKFVGRCGNQSTYANMYLARVNKTKDVRPKEIDTRDINTTDKPKNANWFRADRGREDEGLISRNRQVVRLTIKREKNEPQDPFIVKNKTINTIAQRLIEKYKVNEKQDSYAYQPTRRRLHQDRLNDQTPAQKTLTGRPPCVPKSLDNVTLQDQQASKSSPEKIQENVQTRSVPNFPDEEEKDIDAATILHRATTTAKIKKELESWEEVKDAIYAAVLHPDVDIESDEEMEKLIKGDAGSSSSSTKEGENVANDVGKGQAIIGQLKRFVKQQESVKGLNRNKSSGKESSGSRRSRKSKEEKGNIKEFGISNESGKTEVNLSVLTTKVVAEDSMSNIYDSSGNNFPANDHLDKHKGMTENRETGKTQRRETEKTEDKESVRDITKPPLPISWTGRPAKQNKKSLLSADLVLATTNTSADKITKGKLLLPADRKELESKKHTGIISSIHTVEDKMQEKSPWSTLNKRGTSSLLLPDLVLNNLTLTSKNEVKPPVKPVQTSSENKPSDNKVNEQELQKNNKEKSEEILSGKLFKKAQSLASSEDLNKVKGKENNINKSSMNQTENRKLEDKNVHKTARDDEKDFTKCATGKEIHQTKNKFTMQTKVLERPPETPQLTLSQTCSKVHSTFLEQSSAEDKTSEFPHFPSSDSFDEGNKRIPIKTPPNIAGQPYDQRLNLTAGETKKINSGKELGCAGTKEYLFCEKNGRISTGITKSEISSVFPVSRENKEETDTKKETSEDVKANSPRQSCLQVPWREHLLNTHDGDQVSKKTHQQERTHLDGQVQERTHLDGQVQERTHLDGQVQERTHLDGQVQERTHLDGQVQERTHLDGQVQERTHLDGQVQEKTHLDGQVQERTHLDGQVQEKTHLDGQIQERTHLDGQVQERTHHDGQVQERTHLDGQIQERTHLDGQVQGKTHHDGQVQEKTHHDGQVQEKTHHDGQVQERTQHDGQVQERTQHDGQVQERTYHNGRIQTKTKDNQQEDKEKTSVRGTGILSETRTKKNEEKGTLRYTKQSGIPTRINEGIHQAQEEARKKIALKEESEFKEKSNLEKETKETKEKHESKIEKEREEQEKNKLKIGIEMEERVPRCEKTADINEIQESKTMRDERGDKKTEIKQDTVTLTDISMAKRAIKRPRQIVPPSLPQKVISNELLNARNILKRPVKQNLITPVGTTKQDVINGTIVTTAGNIILKQEISRLVPQNQGNQFLQARNVLKKPVIKPTEEKIGRIEERIPEIKIRKFVKKVGESSQVDKNIVEEPPGHTIRKQRVPRSRSSSSSSDEDLTNRKKEGRPKRLMKPRPTTGEKSPSPKTLSSLKTKDPEVSCVLQKEDQVSGHQQELLSTKEGSGSVDQEQKLTACQSADSGYGSCPSTPQPTPTVPADSGYGSSPSIQPQVQDEDICTVCGVNCHRKCEKQMPNLCGVNQKLLAEALSSVKKGGIADGTTRTLASSTKTSSTSISGSEAESTEDETETTDTDSGDYFGLPEIRPPLQSCPKFKKYNVTDFDFIKVLGKGSYGKVMLAQQKDSENYFAVKCLKKDVVLEDNDVECTLIERKVLSLGTKHPYLCHLFCTFQTPSHLFFVMEYLTGGDLMFHIQHCGRFDEFRACFYAAEITSGLKFLHSKGIIYRDLKLDNILLDYQGHIRIADFGMCKLQVYLDRYADTFCGTPDYMAPEVIKGLHYNQCVDWWSFGVLLYEMMTGKSPFKGCDEDHLFWLICNDEPFYPKFLSKEATNILKQLLDKDSTRRLGIPFSPYGEITVHPFFKYIDWNKIERKEVETPYKPRLRHILDVQYFDPLFTKREAAITPLDESILATMDQTAFKDFSYTNPNITD
nr:uncharacterized protein LOC128698384 [Cherax quadricarinatus]XP_053646582.1 uncharacterized protein LOC128698384 [Cherax quadricarinatus]XP_053646583.1 uncharacterized protein LOC128698384 [Cherax quadricarinatus]